MVSSQKKNFFFTISCCNFTPLRWALRSPRIPNIATIYFLWFNCPCSHSSHIAFYKSPPISSIYPHDSSVMKFAEEGQKVRNLYPWLNVATFICYNPVERKKITINEQTKMEQSKLARAPKLLAYIRGKPNSYPGHDNDHLDRNVLRFSLVFPESFRYSISNYAATIYFFSLVYS